MGLGYAIRKKVMAHQKAKAREEASLYGVGAEKSDAYIDKARKEEYIQKQTAERKAQEQRVTDQAKQGGFKDRFRAGAKAYGKHLKANKKARGSSMGMGNVSMGGSGPNFGLARSGATDISVNVAVNKKGKKGPFDL